MQNLISIIGLSVGILCFSICLYCSRYIVEVDHYFTNQERIAEISMHTPHGALFSGISVNLIDELRKRPLSDIEALTFIAYPRERSYNVEIKEGYELPYDELMTMEVDSLFKRVFTPHILLGSWEIASNTPNAIVLTKTTAEKIFGASENPIGKQMILTQRLFTSPNSTPHKGEIAYSIQAVIEDIPLNTSLNFLKRIDMLTLNDSEGTIHYKDRDNMTGGSGFGLLREGKRAEQLEAHFRKINLTHKMYNMDCSVTATRLGEIFWSNSGAPYFAIITLIIGILILLIGLLNFFYFLIGAFLNRQREYSIRKVIGGDTSHLFFQLFIHTIVVVFLAFLITFCMIELISPYLHFTLLEFILVIEKNILITHTCEYMGFIICLCALLCIITVMRIRHISVRSGIHKTITGKNKHLARNILLGIQFFICWLFVSFTVASYLQSEKTATSLFQTLTEEEKANIISFSINYHFMKNEEKLALIDRICQHPAIEDKLLSDIAYTSGVSGTHMQLEKDNPDSSIEVNIINIPLHFFQFMKIPIIAGQTIQNVENMIIDKTLAQRMNKDMLGSTWYNYSDGYTVCGIVDDFTTNVYSPSNGFVFLPNGFTDYVGHCYLKCKSGKTQEVKKHIENILKDTLPPSAKIKITTLLEDIFALQVVENKLKGIILFLSVVSLIITLLGIYSAITLDTERRQKEVAIRKVNGAQLKQIILLFARLHIRLLVITATIAFPLIYIVLQVWKRMYTVFFDIGLIYWSSIFWGVTIITMLTVTYRILKIARTNPSEIIKNE